MREKINKTGQKINDEINEEINDARQPIQKCLMENETKPSFTLIITEVSRYEFNRDIVFYDIIALLG